jgi:hypothetical protein
MDGGYEHRVAIKVSFKVGLLATGTLVLVQNAYGNEAMNRSKVLFGIHDFEMERWKGAGRRKRERWPSKIDSN